MASPAWAVDIPVVQKPRAIYPHRQIPILPPFSSSDSQHSAEEFDFSDVFGPVQAPLESRANGKEAYAPTSYTAEVVASMEDLAAWAPPESISGGEPLVIYNRSHSLVGPAVAPQASLGRSSFRIEGKSFENKGESSLKSTLVEEGSVYRDTGGLERLNVEVQGMGLSDSCSEASEDEASQTSPLAKQEGSATVENGDQKAEHEEKRLGPQDFELLRVVGQGAFGKVFQVIKKDTGEILAMKVMRKDKIMERNHGDYMKAERDILTKAVHPFIVQLQYSFQTKTKLYLLLDFINGGHLFFQLYRQGTFSEELARIYTAELVLAVAHLHKMGIIHRDLKPENILLDSEGHVKLTDFGLAKEVHDSDSSNSLCGTMEYMAPEILLAKGHGRPADWWSVGILLYEMLTGQPPYAHKNRQKLQQKVIKDKIKFPGFLTAEAHNLLKGLLQKDPSKRLGNGPNGSDDIKGHKWFKNINWAKLEVREIQPKFRPTVNGKHCIANFDEVWTNMPVQDSPAGTPTSDGIDLLNLRGYTYAAPRDMLPTVDSDSQGEESDTD